MPPKRMLWIQTKTRRYPMLTLTILTLVLLPVAVDFALRGRHQTIRLSLVRQDK